MHAYQDKFIFQHVSFCNCINFGGMAVLQKGISEPVFYDYLFSL